MSTQIFIKNGLCKPEYTKIAAHSFSFVPNFVDSILFSGGNNGPDGQATWSRDIYDYNNTILAPDIREADKTVGISLPINLVSDDIVTLSGTVYFNNTQIYVNYGYDVSLILGVYYFNCDKNPKAYTFIPIETFLFTNNSVCFDTSVTLGSNFDIHDTRFLVGFNIEIQCPTVCLKPTPDNNLATLSYTFDIERPCFTSQDNFIIQNCCDPIITELVHIPGLTVGSFHVDDEGNCWEVMEQSTDVTNFTRNFTDLYSSCTDCITANLCPQNLMIKSCCVEGTEYVTGSLPGLTVGDTFVDNHGLCWEVGSETSAPISEESITVDTIIPGGCAPCKAANPCPKFWFVKSCCGKLKEIIATNLTLISGDSFVDTNGICWGVEEVAKSLPTNYDIVVDTVYTGGVSGGCAPCTTANPCPETYFLTVRACCDNDRVEVISVPTVYMSFSEGSIFNDKYNLCWEVMSYSTTGVETYSITWTGTGIGTYLNCQQCTTRFCKIKPCSCLTLWEVQLCGTSTTYIAYASGVLDVGNIYQGQYFENEPQCFEVLGYGYPTGGIIEVEIDSDQVSYATCEECNTPVGGNFREVTLCDTGETITVYITGPTPVPGAILQLDLVNAFNPTMSGTYCVTMGGLAIPQPPLWTCTLTGMWLQYFNCGDCLLPSNEMKRVKLTSCCDATEFVLDTYLSFAYGINGTYAIRITSGDPIKCYTVSLTTDSPLPYSPIIDVDYYNICDIDCTDNYC